MDERLVARRQLVEKRFICYMNRICSSFIKTKFQTGFPSGLRYWVKIEGTALLQRNDGRRQDKDDVQMTSSCATYSRYYNTISHLS